MGGKLSLRTLLYEDPVLSLVFERQAPPDASLEETPGGKMPGIRAYGGIIVFQ